jgi:hypothetical protein
VVAFFVKSKVPVDELEVRDRIDPEIISRFPTDVIEIGEIVAHSCGCRSGHVCGTSVSNDQAEGAGTIGCLVSRESEEGRFLLSCAHVIAMPPREDGSLGHVVHPARADGGATPGDRVGIVRKVIPMRFRAEDDPPYYAPNLVDAAVAELLPNISIGPEIAGIGRVGSRIHSVGSSILGLRVRKSGKETGVTQGMISHYDVTVAVKYPGQREARFSDQLAISCANGDFSRPGDSGALLVENETNNPVGLLFAGGENRTGVRQGAVADGL